MPDPSVKRKNIISNTNSSNKQISSQEEKHTKEQLKPLSDQEDSSSIKDVGSLDFPVDNNEASEREEELEPPKPSYDIMRLEPILTNLIVEKHEGDVDEHGFFQGEACIYFKGGHFYKGTIEDKKMNGHGVYRWADGTVYRGEFLNNSITGHGIYSWPNGSVYEGEVKNGLRHGNGTYKCVIHPSIYIGEWVNGARHGRGILYFDENYETYYDGDWKDGIKHGHGVLKYASGNIYEGQWYQNLRHGKGKMHWFDRGEEYDGEWERGIQNGKGKQIWYLKRVPISQYPIRNEYVGNFVNGQRHGYGVFNYASGARYSGLWNRNLKSGRGEFTFKNGSIFKGMFENDHIVDYPSLVPSGMTTPDIADSGLPIRSVTPVNPPPSVDVGSVDALLNINLKEIIIEERFDIERQQIELDELTRVVLRYMTPIKHIYKFYSSLGILENADNTFVMNRMQFWRFLKDCMLHTAGLTLTELDLAHGISETSDDIHDASTKIYVRDFVNVLINVSYLLFKEEFAHESHTLAKCLVTMLNSYVLPNACIVKGNLFSNQDQTREALKYAKNCEEIFDYFRKSRSSFHAKNTLRIRDFLWILKDFKLINTNLTVSKFLDAFNNEDPSVLEERCFNLENCVVFLEFFETLLECSQHFAADTSEMEDESDSIKNALVDFDETKSIATTKDDDYSIVEEVILEPQKSPSGTQSPDKSSTLIADISSHDQLKEELVRSSSKTQESNGHGKTSAAGGSRKDTKDGSSVGAGSRSRRRGTIENTEADIKHPNTSNIKTKEKGIKEKDKLKNGTKSAKKVAMENEKEKISDTTTSVPSNVDKEHDNRSAFQLDVAMVVADESRNDQQSNTITGDSSAGIALDQTLTNGPEDVAPFNNKEIFIEDENHNKLSVATLANLKNAVKEVKADDSNGRFQIWVNKLQTFFDNHLLPAFALRKEVDKTLVGSSDLT